jgi:hypothetical protein
MAKICLEDISSGFSVVNIPCICSKAIQFESSRLFDVQLLLHGTTANVIQPFVGGCEAHAQNVRKVQINHDCAKHNTCDLHEPQENQSI